jgi:hypothetical protein
MRRMGPQHLTKRTRRPEACASKPFSCFPSNRAQYALGGGPDDIDPSTTVFAFPDSDC